MSMAQRSRPTMCARRSRSCSISIAPMAGSFSSFRRPTRISAWGPHPKQSRPLSLRSLQSAGCACGSPTSRTSTSPLRSSRGASSAFARMSCSGESRPSPPRRTRSPRPGLFWRPTDRCDEDRGELMETDDGD
eukprot:Amastigsp_a841700_941.p2 type:complete len:133 gc:universal Amastigsp_a841700_941:521-123(-)